MVPAPHKVLRHRRSHQTPQSSVEQEEVDTVPFIADAKPLLPRNEREVVPQFEHEMLQLPNQRFLEVGFRILVFQAEELEDERIADCVFRTLDFARNLRTLAAGALVRKTGDLPVQLPY